MGSTVFTTPFSMRPIIEFVTYSDTVTEEITTTFTRLTSVLTKQVGP